MGSVREGRDVDSTSVVPSEMTNDFLGIPAWRERCEEQARRVASAPHELAGPPLLPASDAGSYIRGSVLAVDGAFTSTRLQSYSAEVTGVFGELMPEGLGVPIAPA
jgi:hypothetical protein